MNYKNTGLSDEEARKFFQDLNERFEKQEITPARYVLAVHSFEKREYAIPKYIRERTERLEEKLLDRAKYGIREGNSNAF